MRRPTWLPYRNIGLALAVTGIGLAIYSHLAGKQIRQLKYHIATERSVIIDSEKVSKFEITFLGTPIPPDTDVTSVTMTLWNDGDQSIRQEHILEPIEVRIGEGVRVLEAKVTRSSRDLTRVVLDASRGGEGIVVPKWEILEHGDGAVIQIIYEGSPQETVDVTGTIEGGYEVEEFNVHMGLRIGWWTLVVTLVVMILATWFAFLGAWRKFENLRGGYETARGDLEVLRGNLESSLGECETSKIQDPAKWSVLDEQVKLVKKKFDKCLVAIEMAQAHLSKTHRKLTKFAIALCVLTITAGLALFRWIVAPWHSLPIEF